jgi:hypothetical protein
LVAPGFVAGSVAVFFAAAAVRSFCFNAKASATLYFFRDFLVLKLLKK